jgi:hypothetical protein
MRNKVQNKLGRTNIFGPTTIEELEEELQVLKKRDRKNCREYRGPSEEILRCFREKEAERARWYKETKENLMDLYFKNKEREVNEELLQEQTEAVLPKLENAEETSPRSGGLVSELAGVITNLWNKYTNAIKIINRLKRTEAKAEVKPSDLADAIAEIARECVNNPTDDGYEELVSDALSFGTDVMSWEEENQNHHPDARDSHFLRAVGAIDLHMKRFTTERVKNYRAASIETISMMVKLANTLDQKGHVKEADYLDQIIKSNS